MELVAGAFIVLAIVAITARFVVRDGGEPFALPRIVDDSIGMYVLRRITGRPLGRPFEPFLHDDPLARFRRPSTVLAPRVDPGISLLRRPMPMAAAAMASSMAAPVMADPAITAPAMAAPAATALAMAAPAALTPALAGDGSWSIETPGAEDAEPLVARLRLGLRPAWVGSAIVVGFLAGSGLALVTR